MRTVKLTGTVRAMSNAFGVTLSLHRSAVGTFRGRQGPISVPAHLGPRIVAVLGLDTRPAARPHIRFGQRGRGAFRPFAGPAASFAPSQVAGLYNFPPGTGAGQCIALIELGGGYRPADLSHFFSQSGIAAPNVVSVSVDGATNAPHR
jgi:kumamolisin